ncbi:Na/Pi cotransporter family protein [uncultured Clostridium sp.]|uniref:Na/Pi cotransporter family protein n=1 Tax=uncultured Clostridium sp. TaxID=59620 RepID=UPI0025CEA11C|nr:Na/Pi cotransporter family protein [uncultured Clostridium sp.]
MLKILIELMGGLGLFIYGMKLMGDGLENAAGESLKNILEKVTTNRVMGVLIGTAVTAIIQSSSATTVMVVGFVNAGLMTLSQSLGVIMGANIGTTITAQLVAFQLDQIAPIFVFAGAAIVMFAKVKERIEIGNIILGFGILFTGMGAMSSAMEPISTWPQFTDIIIAIGDNWIIGIIVGLALTALIQSSSATTGILIALASTGAITINLAIPILFGCNIGTCVTALLASIGTNKTAHKAALLHLIFNVVGTIIFIPFLGILGNFVASTSSDISRQIANAHTIFNITNTAILLPFGNYIIKLVNKIIPNDDPIEQMGPKFIDSRFLETPVIAAGQVIKETIRMAEKAKKNVQLAMDGFLNNDEEMIKQVYENEKLINILEESITTYLVKLSKCVLSDKEKVIVASTFHVVIDIERIGDHAENIADLAVEKKRKKLKYSSDALYEINEIFSAVMEALNIAITSYSSKDIEKAKTINEIEDTIDLYQKNYREKHIARLYDGKCNANEGAIFLDLINDLERIGDHSTNIAENVIGTSIS